MMHRVSARSALRVSAHLAGRPIVRAPLRRALQTQTPPPPPPPHTAGASHVVAGLAGGAAVVLTGYGYYRYSGAHEIVSAAQKTMETAKSITDKAPSPQQAGHAIVSAIRAVAPSFFKVIPGLDGVVDKGFEQLDQLAEQHGEEVEELVNKLYADLQKLSKKGFNEDTLKQAAELVQKRLKEAQQLAMNIGGDATDKILEANPELKKAVASGLDELKGMVDVPEVEKILNDTYDELKKLASKGLSPETAVAAGLLVKRQVAQAKEVAGKAGDAAWEKASELAKPYLEKMPEVEKLLDGKLGDLKKIAKENGGPELEKIIDDMYAQLKKVADKGINKDSIAEAKKIVETKVAEALKIAGPAAAKASDFAWDKAAEVAKPYLKKMPEVQELLDGKLGDLKKIAKENGGPEIEKIVTDLYAGLKKIADKGINEKSLAEAKKLVETKLAEASKLGGKVATKAWSKAAEAAQPLLDKAPEYKKLVESQMGDLQDIASKRGPEGEKIVEETYQKIAKIAEKGVSKSTLADMKKVLEEQATKAKKLAEKAADDVKDAKK
ncbi:hypothetical protein HKX48_008080 [Thoreauomyces humboldtii]|nr:hypothetical protein HKX48_008080 [Thoreauomyces humboldtii]